jgi:uncharacterized repeat protein (TIGR03803 family)
VKGSIYGTTASGGAHTYGTVFLFDLSSGAEKVLYSFCNTGPNCSDGSEPAAGLIHSNGTLYGTTYFGGGTGCDGIYGCGTVFSLDQRTDAETVLHAFSGGADGEFPLGNLIDLNGVLYGTTFKGAPIMRERFFRWMRLPAQKRCFTRSAAAPTARSRKPV